MKKMLMKIIFIVLFSLTIVYSFPCPSECICKPTEINDVDFTRMSYLIDCSNQFLNNDKLIYQAEQWSINEDKIVDAGGDDDDDTKEDYIISIDLSNSLSLKKFTNKTIQLSGFSFRLQSLSLANQAKNFILNVNAFYSSMYENLKILNLSSCCTQTINECQQLFRPLNKLQVLDLSGSDMYKTCLNSPDTFSSTLRDLILRNNIFDTNTFSHTSRFFDGIRTISGKLDLQNSRFQMGKQLQGNCLFDLFQRITTLDLSSVQFQSISNETAIHLAHLLKCKTQLDENRNGQQLLYLYLRQLNLEKLPEWFTSDRFPYLRLLDLSNNNFYSIDVRDFSNLKHISLAYNPIEVNEIVWRADIIYESINLRSTIRNRTFDLSHRLKNLFKITKSIDYSENQARTLSNITNIPMAIDFASEGFSLNISRTNLYSFQMNTDDLRRLDISSNSLIELNLAKQIKLNSLDCSNQYLVKLILSEDLLELNQLKCSNNSLKTIENFSLLRNEQLRFIDLSNNLIDSIENLLSNLNSRYLRTINLQANFIAIIPSNIFHQKLISLYEINLSWNQIHTIKKNAFQSPNLQILDLTGNLLKIVEPKAILTTSLRLFLVFNDSQQLTNRCIQSKLYDNFLFMYLNWFKQNGTMMKNNSPIQDDKCLHRYINITKSGWIGKKGKHILGFYSLYIIIGTSLAGMFLGVLYYYRRNKLSILGRFQRYKQIDRNILVENEAEVDQHRREDDEVVMNMEEPPYKTLSRVPTNV